MPVGDERRNQVRYDMLIMMSSCQCTLHLCLFVLSRRLQGVFPSGAVSRRLAGVFPAGAARASSRGIPRLCPGMTQCDCLESRYLLLLIYDDTYTLYSCQWQECVQVIALPDPPFKRRLQFETRKLSPAVESACGVT